MTATPRSLDLPSALPRNLQRQSEAAAHWAQHARVLPPALSDRLRQLRRNGVVVLDWQDLGFDPPLFEELRTASLARRDAALSGVPGGSWDTEEKTYWLRLLGDRDIASDGNDVFARVALDDTLLSFCGHYFGLSPWLMEYNVWHNSPEPGGAKASQLWHRDTEIALDGRFASSYRNILKGFVYLHDVDIGHGPTHYLRETQQNGRLGQTAIPPDEVEARGAQRYYDTTIEAAGLGRAATCATAPASAILIFDASGLHKGGRAITATRTLFKFEYGDWLWRGYPYPKLRWSIPNMGALTPGQRFALGT